MSAKPHQCPHWGIVLKGKLEYTSAGEEIVVEAGEAYYVAPGHLPHVYAGTEVVEFSPTKELHETLAVIEKNMAESAWSAFLIMRGAADGRGGRSPR